MGPCLCCGGVRIVHTLYVGLVLPRTAHTVSAAQLVASDIGVEVCGMGVFRSEFTWRSSLQIVDSHLQAGRS